MFRTNILPAVIVVGTLVAAILVEGPLKWLSIGLVLLIVGLLLKFQDARGRDNDTRE